MNVKDEIKKLRLIKEFEFMNSEAVKQFSEKIIGRLLQSTNAAYFSRLGGELTCEITLGSPNAGISQNPSSPNQPKMEIRLRLLEEIYQDAFTFTLFSDLLVKNTKTLQDLHAHLSSPYTFETGLPQVRLEDVEPELQGVCARITEVIKSTGDCSITPNDVYCRFILFELMLTWTFFHEVAHALQRHYVFRHEESHANLLPDHMDWELDFSNSDDASKKIIFNEVSCSNTTEPTIAAQARELMADAEGVGMVLSYIVQNSRFSKDMVYLLFCSLGCMFQRFYNKYNGDGLGVGSSRHPHPAVRDKILNLFLIKIIDDRLVHEKDGECSADKKHVLFYLSVRANVFVGLFRSWRIEARDDENTLPSYMKLRGKEYSEEIIFYINQLFPGIQTQTIRVIKELHFFPRESLLPTLINIIQKLIKEDDLEHQNQLTSQSI